MPTRNPEPMDISALTLNELEQLVTDIKERLGVSRELSFPPGSVPVSFAAKVYGKDPCWVRAGIIAGWLPIGTATRDGKAVIDVQEMDSKKGRISYYISPKLLYEQTGCLWRGERA